MSSTTFQRIRVCVALLGVFVCCALNAYGQPSSEAKKRLSKIEVSGLQQMTEEQVITASGLQVGEMVDVAALDAAAERLLGTGLFTKLNYRFRTSGDQASVTFVVEEAKRANNFPVVFDNFVWFTPAELLAAVRRELPTFDGAAPNAATAGIAKALERLLRERQIGGQVEYMPSASESGGNQRHVFVVRGVSLPVCALQFPGAASISEKELLANSKPVFETDYSQEFVSGYAASTLVPLYRQRGHLRAKFAAPRASVAGREQCKGGVSVEAPVEEGLLYSWDQAEWSGNSALAAPELSAALGMKAGEVADGLKFDKGLESVQKAYGRKGLLLASLKPTPEFDDATRGVAYRIDVKEGAQFRMGALTLSGLPEADANRLRGKWKLQPGDIYNASYLEEYLKQIFPQLVKPGMKPPSVQTSVKLDRQKLTADVVIAFK